MGTTKFCIASCGEFVGSSQKQKRLNSACLSCPSSAYSSLSFSWRFDSAAFRQSRSAVAIRATSTRISVRVNASSATGVPNDELEASSTGAIGASDLLIVGPGVLGRMVAEIWRKERPGSRVYGQTLTTDHHDELIKLGISPCLKGTQVTHKFPYVIFCAPPSRNSDYPGEVREATLKWNGEGSFLFTSSSATYDCSDNGYCDEDTPVVPVGRSPRTDKLLNVEKVVLEAGGCILRLAGLYISFFTKQIEVPIHTGLKQGSLDIRPDHILNLIHYEDAASLAITILKKKLHGRIFLGCDDNPLSRQEVMELVNKSGKYNQKFDGFTGTTGPLGKKLNNSKTRAELGWEPKYPSFAQFLETL
ncbi:hypothetical protein Salat_0557300 [Sesamum alatum]|uniref:NAD(P)-binding Rossmann-fold superfamily protein n=1 Tax=Sesamum alatum TaxID=300844 RepID=A0AAE1YPD7_9LAMI|nr:hypothetical protein Salat_0557300 [Sesamum alatum]